MLFDDAHNSYALLEFGWRNRRRVHDNLIHSDMIGDKIWIQQDSTENDIANELVEAGVPKDKVVLGFRPEKIRQHTGFAVN